MGHYGQAFGVDISPAMIEMAQKQIEDDRVSLLEQDAEKLEFEDGFFDAVSTTQALAYVGNYQQGLSEMVRVLKPGGRLVILDTDWDCICWNALDKSLMDEAIQGYIPHCKQPYLPRLLPKALENVGLKMKKVFAHPVINTQMAQTNFSTHMIDFVGKYLIDSGTFSEEKFMNWKEDLRKINEKGEYFFCLNRFVFVSEK